MHHKIAFVDLDGTVNSSEKYRAHLVPADTSKEENWAAWHAAHVNEAPNHAVIDTVKALKAAGWLVVILTMRSSKFFKSTEEQLISWGVNADSFIMKTTGDSRSPGLYKFDEVSLFISAYRLAGLRAKVLVVDDSPEVCKALRLNKYVNVLQITPFTGE